MNESALKIYHDNHCLLRIDHQTVDFHQSSPVGPPVSVVLPPNVSENDGARSRSSSPLTASLNRPRLGSALGVLSSSCPPPNARGGCLARTVPVPKARVGVLGWDVPGDANAAARGGGTRLPKSQLASLAAGRLGRKNGR